MASFSHCEEYYLLICGTLQSGRSLPTFRRYVLPSKNYSKQAPCFLVVICNFATKKVNVISLIVYVHETSCVRYCVHFTSTGLVSGGIDVEIKFETTLRTYFCCYHCSSSSCGLCPWNSVLLEKIGSYSDGREI
jgi:hypothetical protein